MPAKLGARGAQRKPPGRGPGLDKAVVQSGTTNIYVRAKNLFAGGAESGTVALDSCASPLVMLPAERRRTN